MTFRDRIVAIAFVVLVILVVILAAVFHGPGNVDAALDPAAIRTAPAASAIAMHVASESQGV